MDEGSVQFWSTVLGVGGVGSALGILARGLVKKWNGSYSRERGRNADLVTQRNDAYARATAAEAQVDEAQRQADIAHSGRRILAEYASSLRRTCIEHGIPKDDLPPWPSTPD